MVVLLRWDISATDSSPASVLFPPTGAAIEKLLSMLGAALLIAAVDPAMREGVLGAVQEGVQEGGGWQRVVELARAAL